MTGPWEQWNHIVKIDPDKDLFEGDSFEDVCQTGTDAIEIGGTTGITETKMERVIDACAKYDIPLYQEPSAPDVVVHDDALDGYLIPTVFNAGDVAWIVGFHKEWIRLDGNLDWNKTFTEAYIVLNPDSSVAKVTNADCVQSADDITAYAKCAERLFGQSIIYIEYSGMYGEPDFVAAAKEGIESATLFYGGGITDYDSAFSMARHADVIVVGNLLHDEGVDAVTETVEAARDANA